MFDAIKPAIHQKESELIMIYDCETNNLDNPMLVQLAAMLIEEDGTERACFHALVKPDGWKIDDGAYKAHGIDLALADRCGLPLRVVVAAFLQMRAAADLCVAHNEEFDHRVINNNVEHLGITPSKPWPRRLCTAQGKAAEHVGLPPTARMKQTIYANKPKTPNLQELHAFLFGAGFEGAHDAMVDVRACARCFVELRKRGVL